jgi:hypothetical protein
VGPKNCQNNIPPRPTTLHVTIGLVMYLYNRHKEMHSWWRFCPTVDVLTCHDTNDPLCYIKTITFCKNSKWTYAMIYSIIWNLTLWKILKKYLHICNVVLYYCVNFQKEICCIFAEPKILKSYTLMEYNIFYIMVFKKNLKCLKSIFFTSNFELLEPEVHMIKVINCRWENAFQAQAH